MDRNFRIKSIAILAKKAGVLETFVKNKLKDNAPQQSEISIPEGYNRIKGLVNKDLQDIAYQILAKSINKPYGYHVSFEWEGKKYLAVLEEHIGGRVEGKHPGISLFEKTNPVEKMNLDQYKNNPNISSRNNKIISSLNPKMQPLVIRFLELAEQNGIPLVLTSGLRSNEEQERLYQQGRTTPGNIVTHARPGTSKHNYGLAVDVAFLNNKQQPHWSGSNDLWERIGNLGESVGLKWGGRWSGFQDKPHFELKA